MDRFWNKVNRGAPDECWIWQAALDRHGYGAFSLDGKILRAHRVAYELSVGPIPRDLQADHLCHTRACVNPAHLELVTSAENTRRGHEGRTHCPHGHSLTDENTYVWTGDGYRRCLACRKARSKRPEVTP